MPGLRVLLGSLLLGYGGLVLVGVLPHDAAAAGAASLAAGLILLLLPILGFPRAIRPAPPPGRIAPPGPVGAPPARPLATLGVAFLGAAAAGGVLGHEAATHSGLSGPEWALLLYGAALMVLAPRLADPLPLTGRGAARASPARWSDAVAWSFPLLLAPLALYALNAALTGPAGTGAGTALAPAVAKLVVAPTAATLRLLGTPVSVDGSDMVLPTARGRLVLSVGLVCAGLYPIVLFLGLLGLHALRTGMAPAQAARMLAAGVAALWLVNVARLALVAKAGQRWGPEALQQAHANLGWVLFALCMVAFWMVALRPRASART